MEIEVENQEPFDMIEELLDMIEGLFEDPLDMIEGLFEEPLDMNEEPVHYLAGDQEFYVFLPTLIYRYRSAIANKQSYFCISTEHENKCPLNCRICILYYSEAKGLFVHKWKCEACKQGFEVPFKPNKGKCRHDQIFFSSIQKLMREHACIVNTNNI